jgi:hypothetical protein
MAPLELAMAVLARAPDSSGVATAPVATSETRTTMAAKTVAQIPNFSLDILPLASFRSLSDDGRTVEAD